MIEISLAIATGIAFLLVYRKGLSDGMVIQSKQRIDSVFNPKFKVLNHKSKKDTEKENRAKLIAKNIENYNGDADGQVNIK